ncbi:MAG: hypothetical protein MHM6MM_004800 [Cercozoa sp. M6MM]
MPLRECRRVLLLGAPGAGKGTYAKVLSPMLEIPHISTGDLIRDEIRAQTPIGREIEQLVSQGELVSDETTAELLRARLQRDDAKKGYFLDGFPRTRKQIDMLNDVGAEVDAALEIQLDEDILVEKIVQRRACSKCGRNYNLAHIERDGWYMPPLLPQKDGVCDDCGGTLVQRSDDREDIVRRRLRTYERESADILKHYKDEERLVTFELTGGVEAMTPHFQRLFGVESHQDAAESQVE